MIRVTIVEDEPEILEGLQALVGSAVDFQVCGAWRTMEEALANAATESPADVFLLDLALPGMSGIEGTRVLKESYPSAQILVLSIHRDDERIFEAICAGASGYLTKATPPAKLIDGIRTVVAGGSPMSPEIARTVIERLQTLGSITTGLALNHHEMRLLRLLVKGHSYKTAAAELGVTTHTISFHLRKIYSKLHVHSKSEAVA